MLDKINELLELTPWEDEHWQTVLKKSKSRQSGYFQWLRGAIRRIWTDNPSRKEWKSSQLRPITSEEKQSGKYHSATKNLGRCYLCNEWMVGSKLEVDHKISSDGCKDWDEAIRFLFYAAATTGDDWALVCKPCHKIKTHSERTGATFEFAKADKHAIAIQKVKGYDVKWLKQHDVVPASNATKRRDQIVDILLRGE